ncbi:MAG: PstC family ABC transporter permease, partial [Arenimonas sp.]
MTISISQQRTQRDSRNDRFFKGAVTVAGIFVLISLFAAAVMMFKGGFQAFQTFGFSFLTTPNWDVPQSQFGALVPVFGTVYTSLIALLIAVPISFGIAIFLTELAPSWLRLPVSSAIELLAGIPSIIYGMWGLFILVPFLGEHV